MMVIPTPRTRQLACLLTGTIVVGLLTARGSLAQATLDRLEQKLLREKAEGRQESTPPRPAPVAETAEPGYIGIVADDRHDRGRGVRILEVKPGSPAEKAGLKRGDLIVGLAGMRLRQMSDMALILEQVRPRGSVAVEVLRGEQRIRVELTAGEHSAVPAGTASPPVAIPAPPVAVPDVAAAPAPLGAAASPQAKIEQLERRIGALERRVAELEALLRHGR